MQVIVTGTHGAVGPVVAQALAAEGHQVVPWDRTRTPIDDPEAMRTFIAEQQPAWLFHIATGSPDWAEAIARLCAEQRVKLIFTSSVSVFSARRQGPFAPDAPPDATDDYGRYKIECEQRIQAANPQALIARLGWQIGHAAGSNNMVDFLARAAAEHGQIEASTAWYPACSFLEDTAASLLQLAHQHPPGIYHLDGNPGLTFYEIVTGLNRLHGNSWTVLPAAAPEQDNRMCDDRIAVTPISARLALK